MQVSTALWQRVMPELTPPQLAVLCVLEEESAIDQSRMGRLTGIDSSTLVPLLLRLEERGFLNRQTAPDDRRRKVLNRTDAGTRMVQEALPKSYAVDEELLRNLSAQQRRALLAALRRIGLDDADR
jgi:DNA-binding MarR family transcriptional regulator